MRAMRERDRERASKKLWSDHFERDLSPLVGGAFFAAIARNEWVLFRFDGSSARNTIPPYAEVRHTVNSTACISAINFRILAAAPHRFFFAVYGQPKLFRSRWLVLRTACLLLGRFITHFYAVINTHGFRVIRFLTNTDRQQPQGRHTYALVNYRWKLLY